MPKGAIVTGAARGIGRAIAERLLSDGFTVAVADVNLAEAQATSAELSEKTGGGAFALYVDVTNSATVSEMAAAALAHMGQVDVLVNNAGIIGPVGTLAEVSEEGWERVMAVNLTGTFLCSKAT